MRILPAFALAVLFVASSAFAQATAPAEKLKKPVFSYKTVDGKIVSPETLRGRIIVIDFWATWCGPCMKEAPHMVKLAKDNADKGVALIGISLDTDQAAMVKVAADKGFTWPQIFDGNNWDGAIAKAWSIQSIPQTFILSPDGEIVWRGHPGRIDAPLEEIIKKYPTQPALRAKTVEILKAALKTVTDDKDPAKALTQLSDIPDGVQPDQSVFAAARALGEKLADDQGTAALKANEPAIKQLNLLGARLAVTPTQPVVHPSTPTTKPAGIAPAVLDAKLALADKNHAAARDVEAYQLYKWVADHAAGTPQAETAAKQVADFDKDPAFADKLKKAQRDQEASSLLWEAGSYEKNGQSDKANAIYLKIMTNYAGTPAAADAEKALQRQK